MATCRECICEDVCSIKTNVLCQLDTFVYEEYSNMLNVEKYCEHFKNKSDYVKREWISVKERLPKQNELVLCYNIQRPKREPFIGRYLGGSYSEAVYAFLSVHRGCSVGTTHWQPLPEPPKKEEI